MVGLLVLVLIILGIIVLYQKANKASDGWLGTILLGAVLGLVLFFLVAEYEENHRRPEEPLGAVVGKILTDQTYWDSSGIDPETCKWDRSMGLPCAVKVWPRYEEQSVVISVEPGSPAWAAGLQVGDYIQHYDNVECVDPDTDKGTQRDKASDHGRALARALGRSPVWVLRRPNLKGDSSVYVVRPVNLNAITHLALKIPANSIAGEADSLRQSTQAVQDQLETTSSKNMAPLSQPPCYKAMPNPLADHGTSSAPMQTWDGLPTLPPLPDFRPMPDPLHSH